MVTANEFIQKVKIPFNEEWGYIYGTWGTIWTAEKQRAATREQTKRYGSQWIGKMVTDCSGLIRWALKQLGEEIVHQATYQYTDWCKAKGRLINGARDDGNSILPGTAVFLQGKENKIHHVGVYIGDNTVIEAKGTAYGVVTSPLTHWDHWGELKMIDYTNTIDRKQQSASNTYATVNNPNNWLNVRSAPSSSAAVAFKVQKGTRVQVLDDLTNADWWKIQQGGNIGYAMSKYLLMDEPQGSQEKPSIEQNQVPKNSNMREQLIKIKQQLTQILQEIDQLNNQ